MTTHGASTPNPEQPSTNIVLLGRLCDNTAASQRVLQESGIALEAVILADPHATSLTVVPVPGHGSLYRASSPRATHRILESLRPELVVAACYPWRLSRQTRAAVRLGVMNIHPSLLPKGRGPDPVFWVYRNGDRETGVTLHLMDDGFDSGPLLAQQRIAVPGSMDAVALERHLFEIGAGMSADLIPSLLAGKAVSFAQDEHEATYQPFPTTHDWIISPLLPAAWAWQFAQGVASLHGPLMVQTQGQLVPVWRAIAWGERGNPPDIVPPGSLSVRFRPGWVVFEQEAPELTQPGW